MNNLPPLTSVSPPFGGRKKVPHRGAKNTDKKSCIKGILVIKNVKGRIGEKEKRKVWN